MTKIYKDTRPQDRVGKAQAYDIIYAPIVTEKATMLGEYNQIVFKISPKANKFQVKKAIKEIFSVDVLKVNTINVLGKTKRFRGGLGKRADYKKAIVTLKAGQSIDLSLGAA